MSIRKRKNAYKVFCRSANRVSARDAVADPEQYPFAPDLMEEGDVLAFHVYLDGYFFIEITHRGKVKYQVLTEYMHPIFSTIEDAEKEIFDMWKKGLY